MTDNVLEKATKLFHEYKNGKYPVSVSKGIGGDTRYRYEYGFKETDQYASYSAIEFCVSKSGKVTHVHRSRLRSRKYLVVTGPLTGKRITEFHSPDYLLFNRSSWSIDKSITGVLVHKDSLKEQ